MFNRRCDHGQRGEIHGVAVARDHLGGDRLGPQPHGAGDVILDARVDIGESADGAGERRGGDFLAGGSETAAGAGELGIECGELDAEGRRLGVDAVAAADGDGVLMLEGAATQRGEKLVDVGDEQVGGAHELHVEAGVEDVRRGQALVDEARVRPDDLGQMGQEGDDVVPGLGFDGVDAGDVEGGVAALGPHGLGRRFRHHADFGHGVEGVRLDLKPDAELGFGRPDRRHGGARIARDHGLGLPLSGLRRGLEHFTVR